MLKTWDEVTDEREEITALRAQTDAERQEYLEGRLEGLPQAMMVDGRLILYEDSETRATYDSTR